MTDRTYWTVRVTRDGQSFGVIQERAWHANRPTRALWLVGACRRTNRGYEDRTAEVDRIPPDGHLCGNCARIIAAQTDEEA